jgi:hypothetical protein
VFANIGADGVQLGDEGADIADVFIVGDNQFSVTRAGVGENGVDVKATAGNVVIAGNRFHGFRPCPPGGQQGCTGSNGEAIVMHVSPAGGATGVTIERNRIWNNSAGIVVGQDVPSNQSPFPSGIAIRNNWIYAHQSAGLVIAQGRTAGISVLHNTFLDNDRHIRVESDPASVTCANNLLAGTGRAAPAPCAAATNPYHASAAAVRFVDPDAAPERDLHLRPESPAVDVATPIPAVRDDIDGDERPRGAAADFGADEATDQPPPPPQEPQLRLLPLAQRLVDTRPGSGYQGAGQPMVGLADPRCYQVAGQVGVPGDATGVLANLTAVGHSTDGWITAFPAGAPIPDTSNLNFDTDESAIANLALLPLGDGGRVCAVGQTGTHLILDVVGYLQPPQPAARAAGLTCAFAAALEVLVDCIRDQFGSFVVPTSAEQDDFRTAVRSMLDGACDASVLRASLAGAFTVKRFADGAAGTVYCVLMEVGDGDGDGHVDKGWGTFIVNGAPVRELNIAIPHPLDDSTTEAQGIAVFKGTGSRSFLLAGSRRDLGGASSCDGAAEGLDAAGIDGDTLAAATGVMASDAGHNVAHPFFAATQALDEWYGALPWTQLQFHGMAAGSCLRSQVHLTHGVAAPPPAGDVLLTLKANLLRANPQWLVTVAGDRLPDGSPVCALNGTTDTAGRFLNDVPVTDCCTTNASTASGRFIHIEQDPAMRAGTDWIRPVIETWPS